MTGDEVVPLLFALVKKVNDILPLSPDGRTETLKDFPLLSRPFRNIPQAGAFVEETSCMKREEMKTREYILPLESSSKF
jgi:hypothetical protein